MADIDLSRNQGKIGRSGNYVPANSDAARKVMQSQQARRQQAKTPEELHDEEIFTTPPTYPVPRSGPDEQVANLGDLQSKPGPAKGRTPFVPDQDLPTPVETQKVTSTPVVHKVHDPEEKKEASPPTPLTVVNNFQHGPLNLNSENAVKLDLSTLPKKQAPTGEDEADAYDKLGAAVERHCKEITANMQDLEKQMFNEFLEAKAAGKEVAQVATDEEVEAAERAAVERGREENEGAVIASSAGRRVFVDDDDDEETTLEDLGPKERKEALEAKIVEIATAAIQFVDKKVTAKDYLTRAMHCKNYLAKYHKQYAELWAAVMFNHDGEAAVHPFLMIKEPDVTAVVECNIDTIKGIHIFDDNDTPYGVYNSFLHKGVLYEYIDYLAKMVVVKLPADMPTVENALKLAKAKLEEDNKMPKSVPVTQPEPDEPQAPTPTPIKEAMDAMDAAAEEAIAQTIAAQEEAASAPVVTEEPSTPSNEEIVREMKAYAAERNVELVYDPNPPSVVKEEEEDDVVVDTPPKPAPVPATPPVTVSSVEVEEEEDDTVSVTTEYQKRAVIGTTGGIGDDIEKDLENELKVSVRNNTDDEEALVKRLKTVVQSAIPFVKDKVNLREFSIDSTPVSAATLSNFTVQDVSEADWILPNANRVATYRGLSGPEIFSMDPRNSNKGRVNTLRQMYGIIYKHITSKKPATFEEWMKITHFSDIDHLYAGLYRATFGASNYIHYECPEPGCGELFLQDYPDFFKSMCVFEDDKAEKKMLALLNSGDTSLPKDEIRLVQVTDEYTFGLKDPSIWSMVMETAPLSEEFLTKYEDLMDTMAFIDSIYVIDRANKKLRPIDFQYDEKNPSQSTAKKITILAGVIRKINSDAYTNLRMKIAKMFAKESILKYRIPACDCPKCGHHFAEEEISAMNLFFMRHQLGALGTI